MKTYLFRLIAALIFVIANSPAHAGPDNDAYFRQFLYRIHKDTSDPDFPRSTFYFLGSNFGFSVPISTTEKLLVDFMVFLNQDGTYRARYRDFIQKIGSDGFYQRQCFTLAGKWAVPDKTLILRKPDGTIWVEAGRHFADGQHGVMFNIKAGLGVQEIAGKQTAGGTVSSQQDPFAFPLCPF